MRSHVRAVQLIVLCLTLGTILMPIFSTAAQTTPDRCH